jgi:CDGSH-type Zn-finger protein
MSLPDVPQKGPYFLEVEPGKAYFWCSCGKSAKQPLCDGAHKGTGMKSLAFEESSQKTVALCGCKHTKHPPFCDGSHSMLE